MKLSMNFVQVQRVSKKLEEQRIEPPHPPQTKKLMAIKSFVSTKQFFKWPFETAEKRACRYFMHVILLYISTSLNRVPSPSATICTVYPGQTWSKSCPSSSTAWEGLAVSDRLFL